MPKKSKRFVVLVTGGREYDNEGYLCAVLDSVHSDRGPITLLVHGGARGADRLAEGWAASRKIKQKRYLPQWRRYGGSAGIVRNIKMHDTELPDLVVAFPGGRGTSHMKSHARKKGTEVMELSL